MVSKDRLISANVLKLKIRDDVNIDGRNFAIMKNHINETPTVDAVEVVHGQWISSENGGYHCSVCDKRFGFVFDNYYCPNCGAKMDGGRA